MGTLLYGLSWQSTQEVFKGMFGKRRTDHFWCSLKRICENRACYSCLKLLKKLWNTRKRLNLTVSNWKEIRTRGGCSLYVVSYCYIVPELKNISSVKPCSQKKNAVHDLNWPHKILFEPCSWRHSGSGREQKSNGRLKKSISHCSRK